MTKPSHRKKVLVDPSEKSQWSMIKIMQTKITVSGENHFRTPAQEIRKEPSIASNVVYSAVYSTDFDAG